MDQSIQKNILFNFEKRSTAHHPVLARSDLLNESDRRLDAKFLELERQLLERSMRSSGAMGTSSPLPSAPPPDAFSSPWSPPRFQSDDSSGSSPAQKKPIIAEWWTMGQNSLMDGALANLKRLHMPIYQGMCE